MSKVSESDVHDACQVIVNNSKSKAPNYAINYAKVGITMSGHELYVQCLYILNNITHWRGEDAKAVRETLKVFVKDYRR